MRFPNIAQTILLIFLLMIFHWFLKRVITIPDHENLKGLIITLIKVVILLVSIAIFLKKSNIKQEDITLKYPTLYLSVISVIIGVLIVFNPIIVSISLFNEEDILKIADSILAKSVDIYVFLNLVILTPIFEELLFRGIILRGLKNNYNTFLALIISSLLFGVFHIDIVGSLIFGLWVGWIFLKTNNILLSIIVHSACNFITFFFRLIAKGDQGHSTFMFIANNNLIISILMFLFTIILFYFNFKKFDSARIIDHNS